MKVRNLVQGVGSAILGAACALLLHGLGIGWSKKPARTETAVSATKGVQAGKTALLTANTAPDPEAISLLPDEEIRLMISKQSLSRRAQLAPLLLEKLARSDPRRAIALLAVFPESAQRVLAENLVESWQEVAPNDALEWVVVNGDTALLEKKFGALLGSALDEDPERALNWILENPEAFSQNKRWIEDAGMGASGATREMVEQFLEKRSDGIARQIAARLAAGIDPDFAMEIASGTERRGERLTIEKDVWKRVAAGSHEAASQVIASRDLPLGTRKEAAVAAAHAFLAEGTEDTLSWGLTLQHPILRSQVIKETLWAWSEEDPIAAIDAADNLIISGDRDAAFSSVADQLFAKPETITPELAVSLQERFAQLPEDTRRQLVEQRWELGRIIDGNLW